MSYYCSHSQKRHHSKTIPVCSYNRPIYFHAKHLLCSCNWKASQHPLSNLSATVLDFSTSVHFLASFEETCVIRFYLIHHCQLKGKILKAFPPETKYLQQLILQYAVGTLSAITSIDFIL